MNLIRARSSSRSSAVVFYFRTLRSTDSVIRSSPASREPVVRTATRTSRRARAQSSAMPAPMTPQSTMPTRVMVSVMPTTTAAGSCRLTCSRRSQRGAAGRHLRRHRTGSQDSGKMPVRDHASSTLLSIGLSGFIVTSWEMSSQRTSSGQFATAITVSSCSTSVVPTAHPSGTSRPWNQRPTTASSPLPTGSADAGVRTQGTAHPDTQLQFAGWRAPADRVRHQQHPGPDRHLGCGTAAAPAAGTHTHREGRRVNQQQSARLHD